ncbi:cell division protein FtsZ [Rhodocytophaga rosea]|uniref:Cell division protein FtsZ n=1 Tax=Rhodocytophaga rosea TaxID=2704465 RepID=A0A6C0GMS5_9BACT|nr:cell division protein FtsZ [Rhodocytophaga rosea]QHT69325.1 cell division protein FtsZ [Rhodocytophaga rosea]
MAENTFKFDIPEHHKSIIKVIGVGGGGSNAVNHMYNKGIKDVEFVVCNTDVQALKNSPVPNRLQIGVSLTEGLGAGANPEKGRNAAIESKEEIRELLSQNTKMVFITAGMGGGTGTGAAPVIAGIAKELGILTVGIVTAPFGFEGKKKKEQAYRGIEELRQNCDTVLVILNDKLREIYGNLSISQAFGQADNVLTTAAKGIAEIITVPGYVNVDFEDVKTVMKDSGAAVMGSSKTEGENRARRAAEEALCSPLLNNRNIHGAQKILLSIVSGEQAELQMDELSEITEFIQEKAGKEADDVIFGHGVDSSLGGSIRVTVIATGFDESFLGEAGMIVTEEKKRITDLDSGREITPVTKPAFNNSGKPVEIPVNFHNITKQEPKVTFDLENDFKVIEAPAEKEHFSMMEDDFAAELDVQERRLRERKERLRRISTDITQEEFKEKLEVPAYKRKNVRLQDVPHSSEKNISRFNLSDDDQILGNNRYLHDNVD